MKFKIQTTTNTPIVSAIIYSLIAIFLLVFTKEAHAQYVGGCYCADPIASQCRCTASPPPNATFSTSQGGIALLCQSQYAADSMFVRKNPICGDPFNPEIIPYCSPSTNNPSSLTCYGTGFTSNTGNLPSFSGWASWDPGTPLNYNGGTWTGITEIFSCWENVFCCARTDISCSQDNLLDQPTSCMPQDGPLPDANLLICLAGPNPPYQGGSCPTYFGFINNIFYNACTVGDLCDLGNQYYSPGDDIIDNVFTFRVEENPKIIPQTEWQANKQYTCPLVDCDDNRGDDIDGTPPETFCAYDSIGRCGETPHCNESECVTGTTWFCWPGAQRNCDNPPLIGWHYCDNNGSWRICPNPNDPTFCPGWGLGCTPNDSDFYDYRICTDDSDPSDPPNSDNDLNDNINGTWEPTTATSESLVCASMYAETTAAFTPGYIQTLTPYLRNIWDNAVNTPNSLFAPFRTARVSDEPGAEFVPVEEWPGEATIPYSFPTADISDPDYYQVGTFLRSSAQAGDPFDINPGSDAKIYFRYLGYLLCARENLLQKLSPHTAALDDNPASYPYEYYDVRCDADLW